MKKRVKKLELRRETLRDLEHQLGKVAAGGYTQPCNTTCDCIDDPNTFSEDCTNFGCPC